MNKQVEGIILNRNGVEDWTNFFAELHSSFKLQAKTWVLKKLTLGKKLWNWSGHFIFKKCQKWLKNHIFGIFVMFASEASYVYILSG